mgnify:CR=1 FL=1
MENIITFTGLENIGKAAESAANVGRDLASKTHDRKQAESILLAPIRAMFPGEKVKTSHRSLDGNEAKPWTLACKGVHACLQAFTRALPKCPVKKNATAEAAAIAAALEKLRGRINALTAPKGRGAQKGQILALLADAADSLVETWPEKPTKK